MRRLIGITLALTLLFSLCACGGGGASPAATSELGPSSKPEISGEVSIPDEESILNEESEDEPLNSRGYRDNGEFLSEYVNGDVCVLKYKIESVGDSEMTIRQNYHTVVNFITEGNGSQYKEIQYWAVADMTSGEENKVVSFTVNEETIKAVKAETIFSTDIEDHLVDLWIHDSLR